MKNYDILIKIIKVTLEKFWGNLFIWTRAGQDCLLMFSKTLYSTRPATDVVVIVVFVVVVVVVGDDYLNWFLIYLFGERFGMTSNKT